VIEMENPKKQAALEELKSHFNDASLVHVSIDFQEEFRSGANVSCIEDAAKKTAGLSHEFARICLPNWWIYFKNGNTPADFYAVEPANDDVVIGKTTTSAFAGSAINEKLQNKGFGALLVSGIYSSACVAGTVRDACQKGYKVFVMEDCVADYYSGKDSAKGVLDRLREKGAVIISSDDVLRALAPAQHQFQLFPDPT